MVPDRKGVALCLAAAIGFGTTTIFATLAYRAQVGELPLLALRFGLSGFLLVAVTSFTRTGPCPSRTSTALGLLLGLVVISVQAGLLFTAVARIGASLAVVLHYSYPALVTGVAIILGREHLESRRLVALALSLLGVALVVLTATTQTIDALGITCALGSACAYTLYILVSDRLAKALDPLVLSTLTCLGAGITLVAISVVHGADFRIAPIGWLWIGALAVFSTVVPFIAFLAGLARVGPSTGSILSTMEPLTAVTLAFILFGQRLTDLQLLGAACILVALMTIQRRAASSRHAT